MKKKKKIRRPAVVSSRPVIDSMSDYTAEMERREQSKEWETERTYEITLPVKAARLLERLTESGLYGFSPEQAAEIIVSQELLKLHGTPVLPVIENRLAPERRKTLTPRSPKT